MNRLYVILALCCCFVVSALDAHKQEAHAASLHRVAGQAGYEQGTLQESTMIQELENDFSGGDLDDYDAAPVQGIADPLEPWNRFWFGFNDIFYLHIASPVYNAYDYIMPEPVQSGLSNFFNNLLFPVRFVNALLQGKVQLAGVEFGRFMINTTVGMGGLIDVAARHKTVVPYTREGEDFGQTLGSWGIGQGFYVVWPLYGPSSLRGSIGTAVDFFIDPAFYLDPTYLTTGIRVGLEFNDLDSVLPLYQDAKSVAVDPYVAMREAYAAYRKQQIMH